MVSSRRTTRASRARAINRYSGGSGDDDTRVAGTYGSAGGGRSSTGSSGGGIGGGAGASGGTATAGGRRRIARANSKPAKKWFQVRRPPAKGVKFEVSVWVTFDDLTENERDEYIRLQNEKEEQRKREQQQREAEAATAAAKAAEESTVLPHGPVEAESNLDTAGNVDPHKDEKSDKTADGLGLDQSKEIDPSDDKPNPETNSQPTTAESSEPVEKVKDDQTSLQSTKDESKDKMIVKDSLAESPGTLNKSVAGSDNAPPPLPTAKNQLQSEEAMILEKEEVNDEKQLVNDINALNTASVPSTSEKAVPEDAPTVEEPPFKRQRLEEVQVEEKQSEGAGQSSMEETEEAKTETVVEMQAKVEADAMSTEEPKEKPVESTTAVTAPPEQQKDTTMSEKAESTDT